MASLVYRPVLGRFTPAAGGVSVRSTTAAAGAGLPASGMTERLSSGGRPVGTPAPAPAQFAAGGWGERRRNAHCFAQAACRTCADERRRKQAALGAAVHGAGRPRAAGARRRQAGGGRGRRDGRRGRFAHHRQRRLQRGVVGLELRLDGGRPACATARSTERNVTRRRGRHTQPLPRRASRRTVRRCSSRRTAAASLSAGSTGAGASARSLAAHAFCSASTASVGRTRSSSGTAWAGPKLQCRRAAVSRSAAGRVAQHDARGRAAPVPCLRTSGVWRTRSAGRSAG